MAREETAILKDFLVNHIIPLSFLPIQVIFGTSQTYTLIRTTRPRVTQCAVSINIILLTVHPFSHHSPRKLNRRICEQISVVEKTRLLFYSPQPHSFISHTGRHIFRIMIHHVIIPRFVSSTTPHCHSLPFHQPLKSLPLTIHPYLCVIIIHILLVVLSSLYRVL